MSLTTANQIQGSHESEIYMGALLVMLILFGLSIYFWVMVVNGSARRKGNEPNFAFWRMKKQDREDFDALSLAFFLIAALFSSLGAIVILVFAIIGFVNG